MAELFDPFVIVYFRRRSNRTAVVGLAVEHYPLSVESAELRCSQPPMNSTQGGNIGCRSQENKFTTSWVCLMFTTKID